MRTKLSFENHVLYQENKIHKWFDYQGSIVSANNEKNSEIDTFEHILYRSGIIIIRDQAYKRQNLYLRKSWK